MIADVVVRSLHFLGIILVAGAVLGQTLVLRPRIPRSQLLLAGRLDRLYALGVILALAAGLLLWFAVGKPAPFYTKNGIFHGKLLLFLSIGILSAYPSVFLARSRRGDPDELVEVPPAVLWSVRAELLLLAVMPVLASLMAKGIGLRLDS